MTVAASIRLVRVTAAAVCTFGAIVVIWQFFRYLAVLPGSTAVAAAAELPLLVIGFWVLRLLRPVHPPDLLWSLAALIWGGTAAAGCALLANEGLTGLWAKTAGPGFASTWSAALTAPLNEEVLKVCGVIMVVLAAPQLIQGPLDGMVFGALTGLGFQVTENVTYGLNAIVLTGGADPDRAVLASTFYRVAGGGLGSHWTMTAVAGAGVGYLVRRGQNGVAPGVCCLLGAMAMHLLYDAPYLSLLVKVAANLTAVAVLFLMLRRDYTHRAREQLTDLTAAGAISGEEAAALVSRHGRRQAARSAQPGTQRDLLVARHREILARIDATAG